MLFCPSTAHPSARDTPFPLRAVAACPRTYGCPLHPNSHGQGPFPYYIPLFPSLPPERPSGTPLHTQPRIAPGKVSKTHLQTERCSPCCSVGNEAAQKCGENGLGGRQELGLTSSATASQAVPLLQTPFLVLVLGTSRQDSVRQTHQLQRRVGR